MYCKRSHTIEVCSRITIHIGKFDGYINPQRKKNQSLTTFISVAKLRKFSTEETTPIPYPPHHFLVNHNIEQVRCNRNNTSFSKKAR